VGLPPRFRGKLMLADPGTSRRKAVVRTNRRPILAAPLHERNYEGLAANPTAAAVRCCGLISTTTIARSSARCC
jgi:hypothetical protein